MPKDFSRTSRVAEQLKRELSVLIREELEDPRLKMPSITEVQVTRDFGHAKVFVSSLDFDGGSESSAEALQASAVLLRQRLGKRLRLRTIPQLHFLPDHLQAEAMQMDALIDRVRSEDRTRHPDDAEPDDSGQHQN